jgi:hypothetical protein
LVGARARARLLVRARARARVLVRARARARVLVRVRGGQEEQVRLRRVSRAQRRVEKPLMQRRLHGIEGAVGEVRSVVAGEGAMVAHGGPVAPLQVERREVGGHLVDVDA